MRTRDINIIVVEPNNVTAPIYTNRTANYTLVTVSLKRFFLEIRCTPELKLRVGKL